MPGIHGVVYAREMTRYTDDNEEKFSLACFNRFFFLLLPPPPAEKIRREFAFFATRIAIFLNDWLKGDGGFVMDDMCIAGSSYLLFLFLLFHEIESNKNLRGFVSIPFSNQRIMRYVYMRTMNFAIEADRKLRLCTV